MSNIGMKSQQFQYQNYTPAEFEQFRTAVQLDGFTITQNTIDTVTGHIGSLTYLTGFYNRNQQVLTVTVKTSPWQSLQDGELESNVKRVVAREVEAESAINPVPVKTPAIVTGVAEVKPLGTNKNIVQPAVPLKTVEPAKIKEEPPKVENKVEPKVEAAPTPSK